MARTKIRRHHHKTVLNTKRFKINKQNAATTKRGIMKRRKSLKRLRQDGGFIFSLWSYFKHWNFMRKFNNYIGRFNKSDESMQREIESYKAEAKKYEDRANQKAKLITDYISNSRKKIIFGVLKKEKMVKREKIDILDYDLKLITSKDRELNDKIDRLNKMAMKDVQSYKELDNKFKKEAAKFEAIVSDFGELTSEIFKIKEMQKEYKDLKGRNESKLSKDHKNLIKKYEEYTADFDKVASFGENFIEEKNKIIQEMNECLSKSEYFMVQFADLTRTKGGKVSSIRDWSVKIEDYYNTLVDILDTVEGIKKDVESIREDAIRIRNTIAPLFSGGELQNVEAINKFIKSELEPMIEHLSEIKNHFLALKLEFFKETPASRLQLDLNACQTLVNGIEAKLDIYNKNLENFNTLKGGSYFFPGATSHTGIGISEVTGSKKAPEMPVFATPVAPVAPVAGMPIFPAPPMPVFPAPAAPAVPVASAVVPKKITQTELIAKYNELKSLSSRNAIQESYFRLFETAEASELTMDKQIFDNIIDMLSKLNEIMEKKLEKAYDYLNKYVEDFINVTPPNTSDYTRDHFDVYSNFNKDYQDITSIYSDFIKLNSYKSSLRPDQINKIFDDKHSDIFNASYEPNDDKRMREYDAIISKASGLATPYTSAIGYITGFGPSYTPVATPSPKKLDPRKLQNIYLAIDNKYADEKAKVLNDMNSMKDKIEALTRSGGPITKLRKLLFKSSTALTELVFAEASIKEVKVKPSDQILIKYSTILTPPQELKEVQKTASATRLYEIVKKDYDLRKLYDSDVYLPKDDLEPLFEHILANPNDLRNPSSSKISKYNALRDKTNFINMMNFIASYPVDATRKTIICDVIDKIAIYTGVSDSDKQTAMNNARTVHSCGSKPSSSSRPHTGHHGPKPPYGAPRYGPHR